MRVNVVDKLPAAESPLEALLEKQLKAANVTGYVREVTFHPKRKWRFDFAWPEYKLAVEVEGWGRHQRRGGFNKDAEKYNAALLLGWRVLRFPGPAVKDRTAIGTIQLALSHSQGYLPLDGETDLVSV